MRRSAWIFLAAILLPSLVLAALAVRSARDQQVVLEHQQAVISQDITDALAKKIRDQLDASKADFIQTTQHLLAQSASPQELAQTFNQKLRKTWSMAEVGFAVDLNGTIHSPQATQGQRAATFLSETGRFLSNRENLPIFAQNGAMISPTQTPESQISTQGSSQQAGLNPMVSPNPNQPIQQASQLAQNQAVQIPRQVVPQKVFVPQLGNLSNT